LYRDKSIGIVIPAHNEEINIRQVIDGLPTYIDYITVVDDASTDKTPEILKAAKKSNSKLSIITHDRNKGNGGARVSGIKHCLANEAELIGLIDGDGQMDISELKQFLDKIIDNDIDLVKGNRFFSGEAWETIPKVRYLGNATLSLLTKIVSGYWHLADSQSGYFVGTRNLFGSIDLNHLFTDYGFPNDLIIHANIANARIVDIPIRPIYNVGEKSGIKYYKLIPKMSWLLFKRFLWRLKEKYIIRDFHPLVFFYLLGFIFGIISLVLFTRIFYVWCILGAGIPSINALAAMFSFMSFSQFTLFAMWFDMEANKELK
jgi:glycosyltransferase involved in cell wall biosynthesis